MFGTDKSIKYVSEEMEYRIGPGQLGISVLVRRWKMPRNPVESSDEGTCVVHVPESKFEADIILNALEREGITSTCRRHEETAYDGIFIPQRGWGAILVPISLREKAMGIIEEARRVYRAQSGEKEEDRGP